VSLCASGIGASWCHQDIGWLITIRRTCHTRFHNVIHRNHHILAEAHVGIHLLWQWRQKIIPLLYALFLASLWHFFHSLGIGMASIISVTTISSLAHPSRSIKHRHLPIQELDCNILPSQFYWCYCVEPKCPRSSSSLVRYRYFALVGPFISYQLIAILSGPFPIRGQCWLDGCNFGHSSPPLHCHFSQLGGCVRKCGTSSKF
jgi:hypothetical protein